MASSRKTATNENISTYGTGKDYTVLATWEAATDIDLVTATQSEVLECYDTDASFNDYVTLDGATTNASYFRIIRPASGQGHDGTPNNGVTFISTTDADCFVIFESNSQIQDIIASLNINSATNRTIFKAQGTLTGLIGCIAFNGVNAGTGVIEGIQLNIASPDKGFAVNCLSHNNDARGFWAGGTGTKYLYNCTAVGNAGNGFARTAGTSIAKNCLSSGHTNDWDGTWTQTTCSAEDAAPTYVNAAGDDFHLAAGDITWIDAGTDLSADADYAFNDDIDKTTISGTWDIGFDEYVAPSTRRIMTISEVIKNMPLGLILMAGLGYKLITRDFSLFRGQR